jgi:nitrilase
MRHQKVTVGAAHVAPVYLNAQATVEKACRLIAEAASGGADLIAFPESFVPGFPVWPSVSPPIRNHSLFELFVSQSIRVPGPEVFQICQAARAAQIIVSIGISESTSVSVGCIWNTNLLIGRDGSILNHHRKLVPTFFEKLIWANGDGSGLRVVETDAGRESKFISRLIRPFGPHMILTPTTHMTLLARFASVQVRIRLKPRCSMLSHLHSSMRPRLTH